MTLLGDGHMTGDKGALTYDQIIAHHNTLLNGFDAGKRVTVETAEVVLRPLPPSPRWGRELRVE